VMFAKRYDAAGCFAKCHYSQCHNIVFVFLLSLYGIVSVLRAVMLSVIGLIVVAPLWHMNRLDKVKSKMMMFRDEYFLRQGNISNVSFNLGRSQT